MRDASEGCHLPEFAVVRFQALFAVGWFSGGGRASHKSRQVDVRKALGDAKGMGATVVDAVEILEAILLPGEWGAIKKRAVQKNSAEDVAAKAWADFGRACANLLAMHARPKWRWPLVLAAVGAKQVGCATRRRVADIFGFKPSRAVW